MVVFAGAGLVDMVLEVRVKRWEKRVDDGMELRVGVMWEWCFKMERRTRDIHLGCLSRVFGTVVLVLGLQQADGVGAGLRKGGVQPRFEEGAEKRRAARAERCLLRALSCWQICCLQVMCPTTCRDYDTSVCLTETWKAVVLEGENKQPRLRPCRPSRYLSRTIGQHGGH